MGRKIVVVGGDLMARGRIRSSAEAASAGAEFVSFGGLIQALEKESPDLLIVDLDDGRQGVLDEVVAARERGLLPATVVGYYSHVDAALGQQAEAAGVTPVRRGQFWSSLPAMLQ